MYRNLTYNFEPNQVGEITLFTWDKHGKPITVKKEHRSTLYMNDPKGSDVSIFGDLLLQHEFSNASARRKFIGNNEGTKLFDCLPATREFLLKEFEGQNEHIDFNKYPLRVHIFDIECAVEDVFCEPALADYPINLLTVYDSHLLEFHVFYYNKEVYDNNDKFFFPTGKDGIQDESCRIVFHHADTEIKLLQNYMEWNKCNFPDILTDWNGICFDVPYLMNRIYKLFCVTENDKCNVNQYLSPVGRVNPVCMKLRSNGKTVEQSTYKIEGVSHLDYLILYREKFGSQDKKPSYNLGAVGEDELGFGKMEYEGSIRDFYKRDFKSFTKYNIQDVYVLLKLDEKKKYIEQTRTLCTMSLVEFESVYTSSSIIMGALIQTAHKNNVRMMTDSGIDKENIVAEKFEGAYVYPTKVGVYREGLAFFDVNSLYPNIMITLNISPETKMGKIISEEDGVTTVRFINGKVIEFTKDNIHKLYEKCTRSSSGILYCKHAKKYGIIPLMLKSYYQKRKDIQAQMKKLEARNVEIEKELKELALLE
jgi:DNA polymerase elongation subunit (family B)